MTTNPWIETSRKIYAALLILYPQEHRAEFGEPMRQVFRDQCRTAYEQRGRFGILLLWLRTLPDLGYTALLEHVTSPRATWGLMEPVPNAPLPWKGVFLILLPGLVFFVGQIAQLTGQNWYLLIYYRAAPLLIVPALIAWINTRRFPLWGLIPIGLLYRLVEEMGYSPELFLSNPAFYAALKAMTVAQKELSFLIILLTCGILFLIWRYLRLPRPSYGFLFWLGVYCVLAYLQLGQYKQLDAYVNIMGHDEMGGQFNHSVTRELYYYVSFLLLIFVGTLFTSRHGFFAILIPIGYLLPAIVIGVPWSLQFAPLSTILIATITVLAYRSLLALIAPIWMARAKTEAGKKYAILVPVIIAIGIHAVMQFYPTLDYRVPDMGAKWGIYVLLNEFKLASAIILGTVLYKNHQAKTVTPDSTLFKPANSPA